MSIIPKGFLKNPRKLRLHYLDHIGLVSQSVRYIFTFSLHFIGIIRTGSIWKNLIAKNLF